MAERRPIYEKLFRAVVVMGAALGAAACYEHGKSPPGSDARPVDAPKSPVDAGTVDVIAIL